MTIPTAQPGKMRLTAATWNEIAGAVNRFNLQFPAPAAAAMATGSRVLYAQATSGIDVNQPVHLTTIISAAQIEATGAPAPVTLTAAPLSNAIDRAALWLGVALAPAEAGVAFPVQVAGVAVCRVANADPSAAWVYYDNGALATGDAGDWRVVPGATPADMPTDCVLLDLGRCPHNYVPASASAIYAIDRTDTADDAKAWDPFSDPSNPLPADWTDYAAVSLTTATLRLASNGSDYELVKVTTTWQAHNAPVIPALAAADVETATADFECEEQ